MAQVCLECICAGTGPSPPPPAPFMVSLRLHQLWTGGQHIRTHNQNTGISSNGCIKATRTDAFISQLHSNNLLLWFIERAQVLFRYPEFGLPGTAGAHRSWFTAVAGGSRMSTPRLSHLRNKKYKATPPQICYHICQNVTYDQIIKQQHPTPSALCNYS